MNKTILIILSLCFYSNAQVHVPDVTESETLAQLPTEDLLEVKLRVANKGFVVKLNPTNDSTENIATRLCTVHAADIGVTDETLNNCVSSINQYLTQYVDSWLIERTIKLPITFDEKTTVSVRFRPDRESVDTMATQVCADEVVQKSVSALNMTDQCNNVVADYLSKSVRSWIESKTLKLPLRVNNTRFDLSFLPQRDSPDELATQLCTQYAKSEGGLTEENFNTDCVNPVVLHLAEVSEKWVADRTVTIPITINEKEFTVKFMPERENAAEMARRLCIERAEVIGGLTNENVVTNCIEPVAVYLQQQVEQWTLSKTLSVAVKVNNETFSVRFMPDRQTAVEMSRKLCVENAASIEGLTDANIMSQCVEPVAQYLQSQVDEWRKK